MYDPERINSGHSLCAILRASGLFQCDHCTLSRPRVAPGPQDLGGLHAGPAVIGPSPLQYCKLLHPLYTERMRSVRSVGFVM